jgi:hypothetical protein
VQLKQSIVTDIHNPEKYKTYLGCEKYYHNFLVFFKEEIDQKGWQEVLNEYIFKGDERADDMLVRMFGGILHPIIHLGFGVEFEQPAIIAEALAQAAVHDNWEALHLIESEKAARAHSPDRRSDAAISSSCEKFTQTQSGLRRAGPNTPVKYMSQRRIWKKKRPR